MACRSVSCNTVLHFLFNFMSRLFINATLLFRLIIQQPEIKIVINGGKQRQMRTLSPQRHCQFISLMHLSGVPSKGKRLLKSPAQRFQSIVHTLLRKDLEKLSHILNTLPSWGKGWRYKSLVVCGLVRVRTIKNQIFLQHTQIKGLQSLRDKLSYKQHDTEPKAVISTFHTLFFFSLTLTLCDSLMDLLPSFSLFHGSLIVLFLNDALQLFIFHNKWTQVNMFAQYYLRNFFSVIRFETHCNLFVVLLSSITFKVFIFIDLLLLLIDIVIFHQERDYTKRL